MHKFKCYIGNAAKVSPILQSIMDWLQEVNCYLKSESKYKYALYFKINLNFTKLKKEFFSET